MEPPSRRGRQEKNSGFILTALELLGDLRALAVHILVPELEQSMGVLQQGRKSHHEYETELWHSLSEAGIEDFRIHDLRHTCAAWLVSAGGPLPEVKDLLRHSTVIMTEKYAHLAPDDVRRAVQRLEW